MAPVPTRQWRGSIVGEIVEDGVYKDQEEGESTWTGEGDVVWTADDGDGDQAWLKMEEGM
ncbi:hypothetical protein IFR05_014811 [Cadophora sp. M221]|nr:hypothetical protein IFR05_014811 [Cadophora sp. M221]